MLFTEVTFGPLSNEPDEREAQVDIATEYFGLLARNGQCIGANSFATVSGSYRGYINLSRKEALECQHHSKWGLDCISRIKTAFGRSPEWKVLEEDFLDAEASLESATFLVFYTHLFAEDRSPIIIGDSGEAAALFLLPISDADKEGISAWALAYEAMMPSGSTAALWRWQLIRKWLIQVVDFLMKGEVWRLE